MCSVFWEIWFPITFFHMFWSKLKITKFGNFKESQFKSNRHSYENCMRMELVGKLVDSAQVAISCMFGKILTRTTRTTSTTSTTIGIDQSRMKLAVHVCKRCADGSMNISGYTHIQSKRRFPGCRNLDFAYVSTTLQC